MQPEVDPLAQFTEIRAIMERSSRFLSLSGLLMFNRHERGPRVPAS